MYYKKINNAALWKKVTQLRELIKLEKNFKKRFCWSCKKDLNIYDFLSDNLEFPAPYLFYNLWQSPLLEFHCCECFKRLKIDEIEAIEKIVKTRQCEFCKRVINIHEFGKKHDYLKISELKTAWLRIKSPIFCDKICYRKYYASQKKR